MKEIIAVGLYCAILFFIGYLSIRKSITSNEYLIGGRSMNFWLTAFAAHASDMSSWLFLAFPASIYVGGIFNGWTAIGLTLFMFLNWQFVAPRIRKMTESYNALTFSSFFESRFADTSGVIRIFTVIMSFWFFTIYISSGLVGLGLLLDSLFGVEYHVAITIGVFIVIPYLFFGGYKTLAWIDLFQGIFLLIVIVIVPLVGLHVIGGFGPIFSVMKEKNLSMSLVPEWDLSTFWQIFLTTAGWGLGYFGQPHIVTKFMGISSVSEMHKAKWVGITWQTIALTAALGVGLVGINYFAQGVDDPQLVFVHLVRDFFPPFISAFVLCAALGATISVMDSQILVLASNFSEDIYKRLLRKTASSKEILVVSRSAVLIIAAFAYSIAFFKIATIYKLVLYAWAGLGASFGPILLFSLYSKQVNKYGAWAGILTGGFVSALWPLISKTIPALIPGFLFSCIMIYLVSRFTKGRLHGEAKNPYHE